MSADRRGLVRARLSLFAIPMRGNEELEIDGVQGELIKFAIPMRGNEHWMVVNAARVCNPHEG